MRTCALFSGCSPFPESLPRYRPIGPISTLKRVWQRIIQQLTAPQLLFLSFLGLIVLGTVGLKTLPGLYTGPELSWLDALFTSTSAVCVTGLIVVDTATYFTPAGQGFILLLIQLGGLGIITLTTVIITSLGLRLSLTQHDIARASANVSSLVEHRKLARNIILYTLGFEAVGALLLFLIWIPDFGVQGAWWPAVFHSISAFCNAGFSTFSDSLVGSADRPSVLLVVMILIVVGGLGFLVLEELVVRRRLMRQGKPVQLSVHSRLVLWSTAFLVVGGWLLFTVFEWNVSFAGMHPVDRVVNGLFMSVTARTAGFNTVDYFYAANNSDFLTVLLMSVGGSPGSAAGGLKTTTVALIGIMAWCRFKGREHTAFGQRTIPDATVQRSVGLFVMFFGLAAFSVFIFTTTELSWSPQNDNAQFLPLLFEAVSALNTVGLSMGVTGELSPAGRVLTIFLMFLGRVGPLTAAAALAARGRKGKHAFRDAYEDIVIG